MMKMSKQFVFLAVVLMLMIIAAGAAWAQDDRCSDQYDHCLSGYRTQTAGAWGALCNGGNAACIRDANFSSCFPSGLTVGGNHTVRFTSSAALEAFLPDGGTSHVLTMNYTNPTHLPTGSLSNQLITLAITLGFSDCGVAGFGNLGSLVIVNGVDYPSGPFSGWTVRQVFQLANTVLGGNTSVLPAGISLGELASVLEHINACFDNGTANTGYLWNPNCWDRGDLQACYPTADGPKHRMTGIAWLGARVSAESNPAILNSDTYDDGVTFLNEPWMPCEEVSVQVVVTAGPNYQDYVDRCHYLYLNAWKDGNLDCDFCDVLCDGAAPEWIIQNHIVQPGTHVFSFMDPGIFTLGTYEGRLRFRLTDNPIADGCAAQDSDEVGEVEDYIVTDLQLAVELMGGLISTPHDAAINLAWSTASESDNDHFEVMRDGAVIATRPGAGTSTVRHNYHFEDSGLLNGRSYNYTLVSVTASGSRQILASASGTPQGVAATVNEFALLQNYPNPFNPTTTISYNLRDAAPVKLTVFDLTGREVAELVNGSETAGAHTVSFDATGLSAGVYFYRLTAGEFTATRKLMLLK
jgi:hypothetical protein